MDIGHDDLIWLAGLLEGEGSFMKGPPSQPNICCVSIQMTDEDVIQKVSILVDRKYFSAGKQKDHHKVSYKLYVRGSEAVELMEMIRPYMFERRKGQIDNAISCHDPKGQFRKIPEDKEQEILDRFSAGERAEDLAAEYGATKWAIYRMKERMGH